MSIPSAARSNLTERLEVLLGMRGDRAQASVRRGDLEDLVNAIIDRRDAKRALDSRNKVGSVDNGLYMRLDDGFQVCWLNYRASFPIDVAYRGQFRSAERLWRFPAQFAKGEETSISAQPAYASASGSYVIETHPGSCRWALTNATTQTSAQRIVHLIAIGRWR